MSEIGALLGIYGAVDRAVQSDAGARAEVSRLLPLYHDPGLRWSDDFETWLRKERPGAVDPDKPLFPAPHEHLEELHEFEPEGRLRPRRLFAIAVAARAFPEMRDPGSELGRHGVKALRAGTVADSDKKAVSLLELLGETERMPSRDGSGHRRRDWWAHVVSSASTQKLISDADGMFPHPCSGELVSVPGDAGPAAALRTEYSTEELDFEAATRFISPENWKKCMPDFWCLMKEVAGAPPGLHRYHEVVSSDCEGPGEGAFRAETELDFNFAFLPEGAKVADAEAAIANYQLAEGRPTADDLIRVDEGTVVVARSAPGSKRLLITTTKRIQFNYPFSSEALATMMCALGYADVAGNLLSCCARNAGKPKAGTKFQAGEPRPRSASPPPAPRTRSGTPGGGPGKTAGQMMQDMAGTYARVLREGATAVGRGTRGTGTAGRPGDRSED